jgi:cytochrome c-type biogenesis protein
VAGVVIGIPTTLPGAEGAAGALAATGGLVAVVRIESLSLVAVLLAFAAGFVSFASPCVLPLVPTYLSYLSGVGVEAIERQRRRVLAAALAFVAGFTTVFLILGLAAGGFGRLLDDYQRELTIVAGVFFILSGLVIAGVVRVPALATAFSPKSGGAWRAYVAGAAVTLGWTPCAGPVLGSILGLAGSSSQVLAGAVLLLAYSIGLGLPFIVVALAYGWAMRRLAWIKRHYRAVEIVSGAFLVLVGVLLISGGLSELSRRLPGLDLFGL